MLAPGRVRHSTGMSVGAWFVPGLMLFRRRQIVNDVWRASRHPAVRAAAPPFVHRPASLQRHRLAPVRV